MTPATSGVDHVGLAVKDLKASAAFFIDVLHFEKLGEKPDYPAVFVTDGHVKITLWQVAHPQEAAAFNREQNVGLHHLAFKLESFDQLNTLYEKLKTIENVFVEFAPEFLGGGPSRHMMIYEPSGIRIEFIVRAA